MKTYTSLDELNDAESSAVARVYRQFLHENTLDDDDEMWTETQRLELDERISAVGVRFQVERDRLISEE